MHLSAGSVIAQRFELEQLLGEGGMGAVWSARHVVTQNRVALKFLKTWAEPDLVKRFVREARAASAVRHPNVIVIHDVLMLEDGAPVMVMDLLDGESLASRLARTGTIPVHELASIMVPVLSAIGAAHALGIVHRDLKPDNIFLVKRAGGEVEPKVLDFGICKLTSSEALVNEDSTLTVTGSLMGTPVYMAPEQIFGERDLDARADVWALGVILYECTAGKRPFNGDNLGQLIKQLVSGPARPLQELAPHVPPEFAKVVNHMLTQDRNERALDLREPFDTLKAMTDVGAQSFGAAATVKLDAPSLPPPGAPSVPMPLPASVAVNLTSSVVARPARPRRVLLGVVAATGLLGVMLVPFLWGRMTPSAEPRPATSAVVSSLLAPATIATPVSSVAMPATAASSSTAPVSAASTASSQATRDPARTPAKSGRRTLAGGVHGSVPF